MFPRWAWSGSREQFLHCGLRKFRHSKSLVYRWYPQLDSSRFVYDTYRTLEAIRSRHCWVHMFITHRPAVTLQLHNFDLFRTCRTSSFCTVAWQLARFQLTRRIARSVGDSWVSCTAFLANRSLLLRLSACDFAQHQVASEDTQYSSPGHPWHYRYRNIFAQSSSSFSFINIKLTCAAWFT